MNRLIFIISLVLISCSVSRISQGIKGTVTWYEGDRMPGINRQAEPGKPVRRVIYIYSLTNRHAAVEHDGVFYDSIRTRLVKKIKSDKSGMFSVNLVPGQYSVFTKEEQGLYANRLDGSGNINPVSVRADSVTTIDIRVDYKATY